MSFLRVLRTRAAIAVFLALWVPAVGYGINVLWKFAATPGRAATPPLEWPAFVPVERTPGRPTLVMFAHPQCECSEASIGELAIIIAHTQGKLDAHVFFYVPRDEQSEWAKTKLWQTASAIPGVDAIEDRDAAVARAFGSYTSGQTLLYDADGRLLFKGGITAFRGHSGDNAGRLAVTALLQGEKMAALPVVTPAFGCSLMGAI